MEIPAAFVPRSIYLCATNLSHFTGQFAFTYNRGHGECRNPVSKIKSCTEDTRMMLNFQACPDVEGTESTGEAKRSLKQLISSDSVVREPFASVQASAALIIMKFSHTLYLRSQSRSWPVWQHGRTTTLITSLARYHTAVRHLTKSASDALFTRKSMQTAESMVSLNNSGHGWRNNLCLVSVQWLDELLWRSQTLQMEKPFKRFEPSITRSFIPNDSLRQWITKASRKQSQNKIESIFHKFQSSQLINVIGIRYWEPFTLSPLQMICLPSGLFHGTLFRNWAFNV